VTGAVRCRAGYSLGESDAGGLYLAGVGVISASLCCMAWSP
jgi:hypothetical protein